MTLNDLTIENKSLQGNVMMAKCPSREIFQHLTSRWGGLVLIVLLQGVKHLWVRVATQSVAECR